MTDGGVSHEGRQTPPERDSSSRETPQPKMRDEADLECKGGEGRAEWKEDVGLAFNQQSVNARPKEYYLE